MWRRFLYGANVTLVDGFDFGLRKNGGERKEGRLVRFSTLKELSMKEEAMDMKSSSSLGGSIRRRFSIDRAAGSDLIGM